MAPVAVAARLDRDQDSQCDGEHADRDQRGDLDRDGDEPHEQHRERQAPRVQRVDVAVAEGDVGEPGR